jgi:hypothetical protein
MWDGGMPFRRAWLPKVRGNAQSLPLHLDAYFMLCNDTPQFVALEGYRKFGLVHSSQVSNFLSFSREDSDEQKKAELVSVKCIQQQLKHGAELQWSNANIGCTCTRIWEPGCEM